MKSKYNLNPDQKAMTVNVINANPRMPLPSARKLGRQLAPVTIVLDIETAPIEALVWKIWEENVGIEQIKNEWNIKLKKQNGGMLIFKSHYNQ